MIDLSHWTVEARQDMAVWLREHAASDPTIPSSSLAIGLVEILGGNPPAVNDKTRRRVLSALRTGRARAQAANSERIVTCSPNKPGWDRAKWNREHPHVDEDAAMADAVLDAVLAPDREG